MMIPSANVKPDLVLRRLFDKVPCSRGRLFHDGLNFLFCFSPIPDMHFNLHHAHATPGPHDNPHAPLLDEGRDLLPDGQNFSGWKIIPGQADHDCQICFGGGILRRFGLPAMIS